MERKVNKLKTFVKELGYEVIEMQKSSLDVQNKKDGSPITKADNFVNDELQNFIRRHFGLTKILSEETKLMSYEDRQLWKNFFVIDPIDGTKEYISGGTDFTINVRFISNQNKCFSIVSCPRLDKLYFASAEENLCFLNDKKITVNKSASKNLKIVVSKSHLCDQTKRYLDKLSKIYSIELKNFGSSLKICSIAEGSSNLYPRISPTSEWDTAAAHLILKIAGGNIFQIKKQRELMYNKKNILNPSFVAFDHIYKSIF